MARHYLLPRELTMAKLGGPLVRVKQGDELHITLVNKLAKDKTASCPNAFQLANTTNIHLHGMHVSPSGMSDDIFRQIAPGTHGNYVYKIPIDHPVGTFWYHPHNKGSSSLQQGGGMAGALIVDPKSPETYYDGMGELASMKESVLLLQHLCFHDMGKYQSSAPYINHLQVSKWGLDQLSPNPVYRDPSRLPDYIMANGQYQPNITVQPGEFRLFRLINAGTNAFLRLRVVSDGSSNPECDTYIVAKDGIYVGNRAYLASAPLLAPGSRIDVAIRCNVSGIFHLASQPQDPLSSNLARSTIVYSGKFAAILVSGEKVNMSPPLKLPPPP